MVLCICTRRKSVHRGDRSLTVFSVCFTYSKDVIEGIASDHPLSILLNVINRNILIIVRKLFYDMNSDLK